MKTIAILSGKGGAGKTTLAVHLAVASEQAGHSTALIDLDPQASAFSWKDTRPSDTNTPSVTTGLTVQETEPSSKASQEVLSFYTHITKQIGVSNER